MQQPPQAEAGKDRGLRYAGFRTQSKPATSASPSSVANIAAGSRFAKLSPEALTETASSSPGTEYWLP
jgi:hypothetical protein